MKIAVPATEAPSTINAESRATAPNTGIDASQTAALTAPSHNYGASDRKPGRRRATGAASRSYPARRRRH